MRRALYVSLLLATSAVCQDAMPIGQVDLGWPNTTGQGTPTLFTRVLYPSTTGGINAPILPNPSGWPVIVFLHGFGFMGRDYVDLANSWVHEGFAVVLQDCAIHSYIDQVSDGAALYPAIVRANRDAGTFFAGAFDTQRIAIAGHSMGGGTMGMILGDNPGFRCGFAIAPVLPGTSPALVQVPVGMAVGLGDTVTPWTTFTYPYYHALAPTTGMKFAYLMDANSDHMNIAGLTGDQHPSMRRVSQLAVGFFRHFMAIDPCGLEKCIGPAALADPQLVLFAHKAAETRVWAAEGPAVGQTTRISVVAEKGLVSILAAPSIGWSTPTPVGTLLLDPSGYFLWTMGVHDSGYRFDAYLAVPHQPAVVGLTLAMQSLGATASAPLQLGSAFEMIIGP